MASAKTEDLISSLLGSAHLFISAVSGVMEEKLLAETSARQLTLSQLKVLKLLQLTEARNIGDVAAFLGISNAAASKAVDRMVRRKFLRRVEARSDRRASELSLTESGRNLLNQYDAAKNQKLAKIFRDFDPEDLTRTADLNSSRAWLCRL